MLERLPDESDKDYERRVQKAEKDKAEFLEKNKIKKGGDYRRIQLGLNALETGILKFDMACGWMGPDGICGIRSRDMFEVCGQSATGKCLGKGTPVLKFDGSVVPVEEIQVGDLLMGPDSQPRRVKSLARGREEMFKVIPKRAGFESFTCNKSHILSLKTSGYRTKTRRLPNGKREVLEKSHGEIFNLSVEDFLNKGSDFKKHLKLWKTGIDFNQQKSDLIIPPYILGLWLGDGNSRKPAITNMDEEIINEIYNYAESIGLGIRVESNGPSNKSSNYCVSNLRMGGVLTRPVNPLLNALRHYNLIENKRIPKDYLMSDHQSRLELLVGLIDSDGSYDKQTFVIMQKSDPLSKDIVFLARSLGFAASHKKKTKWCVYKGEKRYGIYNSIYISGDIPTVPCRLERKQASYAKNNRSQLVSKFELESLGEGDYYGFELEGPDRLFLLGDFTVTHNTALADQLTLTTLKRFGPHSVVWICSEPFEPQRLIMKGIDPDDVIVRTADDPDYEIKKNLGEDLMEFGLKMAEKDWVHAIIVDSVAALTTNRLLYDGKGAEAWRPIEVTPVANLGTAYNNFCFQYMRRNKHSILCHLNHWNPPIETMFSLNEDTNTPGGTKKQFLSNVRARTAGHLDKDREAHSVEGNKSSNTLKSRIEIFKNKYCNPTNNRIVKVEYDFLTQRYDNELTAIEWGSYFGTRVPDPNSPKESITVSKFKIPVASAGAMVYIGDKSIRGKDNAIQYLIDNPEIYNEIKMDLYKYRDEFFLDNKKDIVQELDG